MIEVTAEVFPLPPLVLKTLEMCSKRISSVDVLFSLVYIHAIMVKRKTFGPQGWDHSYQYNTRDLSICVNVVYNYLEANTKVGMEGGKHKIHFIIKGKKRLYHCGLLSSL